MPTLAPVHLSGSTNGRQIKVVAIATPGTTLHTATAVAGSYDELWLYAQNSDTVTRRITIEFGGTTSPDDLIEADIPPKSGPVAIVQGIRVSGGVLVRAFGAAANVLMVHGNVNRYTA